MVGEILKEKRTEKGLSHEALAKLSGVHRSTVSRVESNQINATLFALQSISGALKTPLSKIIAEAEKRLKT